MLPAIPRGKSSSNGTPSRTSLKKQSAYESPRDKHGNHGHTNDHKEASPSHATHASHGSHHIALSYSPIATLQNTGTGATVRLPSSLLTGQSHVATMVTHPHQTGYGYSTLLAARHEHDTSALSPPHVTRTLTDAQSPPSMAANSNDNNNLGSPAPRLFVFGPTNVSSSPSSSSSTTGFRTSLPRRTMRASTSHGVLPGGAGPPAITPASSSPKNRTLPSSHSSASLPHTRAHRQSNGHSSSSHATASSSSSSSSSVSASASSAIHHVIAPAPPASSATSAASNGVNSGIMLPSAPMGGNIASRSAFARPSPASEPSAAAKRYAGKKKANGGRIEPLAARATSSAGIPSSTTAVAATTATTTSKAGGNGNGSKKGSTTASSAKKSATAKLAAKRKSTKLKDGMVNSTTSDEKEDDSKSSSTAINVSSSPMITGPDETSSPIRSPDPRRRGGRRRALSLTGNEPVWCRIAARNDGTIALKWRADAEDTDSDDEYE